MKRVLVYMLAGLPDDGHFPVRIFFLYIHNYLLLNVNTFHYNSFPFGMFVNVSRYKRAERY